MATCECCYGPPVAQGLVRHRGTSLPTFPLPDPGAHPDPNHPTILQVPPPRWPCNGPALLRHFQLNPNTLTWKFMAIHSLCPLLPNLSPDTQKQLASSPTSKPMPPLGSPLATPSPLRTCCPSLNQLLPLRHLHKHLCFTPSRHLPISGGYECV